MDDVFNLINIEKVIYFKYRKIIEETTQEMMPIANTLFYEYDDDQMVKITCTDIYYSQDCQDRQNENGWILAAIINEQAFADQKYCDRDDNVI